MAFYRDVPKPHCWPPPTDAGSIQSLIEYAKERDPRGDKIHIVFACLFMACLPLATAPASISMTALVVLSLLRMPVLWRTITPVLTSKAYLAMFIWAAWSTVSIFWSTDKTMGLDHASSMWFMALPLPLLLWPVIDRWKWLIGAFLLGVAIQNFVQIGQMLMPLLDFQYCELFPEPKSRNRPSGLTSHPGNSTIFMACAAMIWLLVSVKIPKLKFVSWVGLSLSVFGIVIAQSRGVWLGFTLSMLLLITLLVKNKTISIKRVGWIGLSVVILSAVSSSFVFNNITKRIKDIPIAFDAIAHGEEIKSGTYVRIKWWKTTFEQSFESPFVKNVLVGHGLGSSGHVRCSGSTQSASHPHNAFVQILYECGLVGLALFIWMILIVMRPQYGNQSSFQAMAIALAVCWTMVALFDGGQNSGRVLTLFAMIALFHFVSPVLQTIHGSRD